MVIDSTRFEFEHGHKPRGRAYWAFRVGDDPEPYWSKPNQLFREACKELRKLNRNRLDVHWVEVLP